MSNQAMLKKCLAFLFLLIAVMISVSCSSSKTETEEDTAETNVAEKEEEELEKPEMQIDQNKQYEAIIKTSSGDITVALNAKDMPITVNNFVYLANKDFYNDTIFHRVIKGFMIQGGDPSGDGTGGPGYKFDDEPFQGEYTKGTIAMANAGPNTNGSQFFVMHQDYALPKNYIIFGNVIGGIEIVDKIAEASVGPNAMGENSKPSEPVVIESIEIVEK